MFVNIAWFISYYLNIVLKNAYLRDPQFLILIWDKSWMKFFFISFLWLIYFWCGGRGRKINPRSIETTSKGSYRIAKNDKKKKTGIFKIMYSITSDIVYWTYMYLVKCRREAKSTYLHKKTWIYPKSPHFSHNFPHFSC
jgi:hypothetical protein